MPSRIGEVKGLKLLAGSALLCGRLKAAPSDVWVLRYVWDRAEQIAPLRSLINGILEQHRDEPAAHPLARPADRVDGEDLARQIEAVERELQKDGQPSLTVLARLRQRVADLADRSAWIGDESARKHLLQRTGALLKRLG